MPHFYLSKQQHYEQQKQDEPADFGEELLAGTESRIINDLLDLVGRGKESREYELQLVRIAAKYWMYLDRNRDSLRLTNMYYSKYYSPGEEAKGLIDESPHVKYLKKYRTILEGLFQAMGLPNRLAFECDESKYLKK